MSKAKSDKNSPDLDTPDRPAAGRSGQDLGVAQYPAGGCLRAVCEDQELSLARQRPAFPRLSSDARRAVRRDLRHHRSARRTGAQARRHHGALDRADRKAADHQGQQRRLRAAARDAARVDGRQQAHGGGDAKGAQAVPTITRIPAPPACSRPSSTRPSGAPGSCSRPAARKAATRRNTSHNRHCEERMRRRLRHSGAMRSIEPGSSRFRVRAGARPGMTAGVDRNDGSATCPCARASDRKTA